MRERLAIIILIKIWVINGPLKLVVFGAGGRVPWSSGKGKRLTFQRSWVRIPAPYAGWTFFPHIFVVKIVVMFV